MASSWKVLGQQDPLAATLTDCYIVPDGASAVISSIIVCNRSSSTTFRISVAVAGATDDPKQYIAYDAPINAHDTMDFTIGVTLSAGDVIRVYTTDAHVSFNVFGEELA